MSRSDIIISQIFILIEIGEETGISEISVDVIVKSFHKRFKNVEKDLSYLI